MDPSAAGSGRSWSQAYPLIATPEATSSDVNLRPRRRPGRPRLVTGWLVLRTVELRRSGWKWKDIGREVGLAPETCRRAVYDFRRLRRTVGNPDDGKPAGR